MVEQIQIITTPGAIQEWLNNSVKEAFEKLTLINNSQSKIQEQPITVKELCDFLGVTEATIIRWRNNS